MNKFIIITLTLLFINVINCDMCYRCIAPNTKIPNHFGEDLVCVNNYLQTFQNGSFNCGNLPTLGQSCDGDCASGYFCMESKCVAALYIDIGGKCKVDYECINANCIGNVCTQEVNCAENTHCPWNKYCDSDTCLPKLVLGDSCSSDYMCSAGLICYGNECTKAYTIQEGDECDTSDVDECDVSEELYCSNDNQQSNYVCTKLVPTASNVQCNGSSTVCKANEYCDCASNSCKPKVVLNKGTATAHQNFIDCAVKNKCNLLSSNIPESCHFTHCGREVCKSFEVIPQAPCINANILPFCKKLLESESSDVSSSNLIQISSILLILSIILSLYF